MEIATHITAKKNVIDSLPEKWVDVLIGDNIIEIYDVLKEAIASIDDISQFALDDLVQLVEPNALKYVANATHHGRGIFYFKDTILDYGATVIVLADLIDRYSRTGEFDAELLNSFEEFKQLETEARRRTLLIMDSERDVPEFVSEFFETFDTQTVSGFLPSYRVKELTTLAVGVVLTTRADEGPTRFNLDQLAVLYNAAKANKDVYILEFGRHNHLGENQIEFEYDKKWKDGNLYIFTGPYAFEDMVGHLTNQEFSNADETDDLGPQLSYEEKQILDELDN